MGVGGEVAHVYAVEFDDAVLLCSLQHAVSDRRKDGGGEEGYEGDAQGYASGSASNMPGMGRMTMRLPGTSMLRMNSLTAGTSTPATWYRSCADPLMTSSTTPMRSPSSLKTSNPMRSFTMYSPSASSGRSSAGTSTLKPIRASPSSSLVTPLTRMRTCNLCQRVSMIS